MVFTRHKTGAFWKLAACRMHSIGQLIDDDDDILWECEEFNFTYYAIIIIHSKPENWANRTFGNLSEAVDAFLQDHGHT